MCVLDSLTPFPRMSIIGFMWKPMIPMIVLILAYSFLRITRLQLQTTGGLVILASDVSLLPPVESLERFERIKRAIERGISSQRDSFPAYGK